tara:strand:- start:334 stop:600 length:267 start_codon:yes stop_codon:yes gene_type:complete
MKSNEEKPELTRAEKNDVLHRIKSREIVSEVLNFGVSQSQILYIIRLLSLELEDAELMQSLNDVIRESERFAVEGSADLESGQTKIYT